MSTAAEKAIQQYSEVKEGFDPFNGVVAIFEDHDTMGEERFWVEHQRKDIYTDFITLDEAENQFASFINDTQF